jgi:hypothetical protein
MIIQTQKYIYKIKAQLNLLEEIYQETQKFKFKRLYD